MAESAHFYSFERILKQFLSSHLPQSQQRKSKIRGSTNIDQPQAEIYGIDSAISGQLARNTYEERKAGAHSLEKQVRECQQRGDQQRISQIIGQLVDMFSDNANPRVARLGGLLGLAGTAIGLGVGVAQYLENFMRNLLDCFADSEPTIRYYSAESLYNIAKVSKGEILVYFNDIFSALTTDSEQSVRSAGDLLDRLFKDIVIEFASVHVPIHAEIEKVRAKREVNSDSLVPNSDRLPGKDFSRVKKTFSLGHFIPLLKEKIYVSTPFNRGFILSWVTVLDAIPELGLISYFAEFFDGLLNCLSDPTEDVRDAAAVTLDKFLDEIRDVSLARQRGAHTETTKSANTGTLQEAPLSRERGPPEQAGFINENDVLSNRNSEFVTNNETMDGGERGTAGRRAGRNVSIDHPAIIEILITQLDGKHEEIQQSTALSWLADFPEVAQEPIVRFTPQLISAILPNLAHQAPTIRSAAVRTDCLLFSIIQNFPSKTGNRSSVEADLFNYQATVKELLIQFRSEFEKTRAAALKWLTMLYQKSPKQILAMDSRIFPPLLKTLWVDSGKMEGMKSDADKQLFELAGGLPTRRRKPKDMDLYKDICEPALETVRNPSIKAGDDQVHGWNKDKMNELEIELLQAAPALAEESHHYTRGQAKHGAGVQGCCCIIL